DERDHPINKHPVSAAADTPSQCNKKPFGATAADKLALLAKSLPWSTNLGHPGYANPAEGELFDTYVITDMFAKAATGAMSPKDAMMEANTRARQIFDKWRAKKMGGGGGKNKKQRRPKHDSGPDPPVFRRRPRCPAAPGESACPAAPRPRPAAARPPLYRPPRA